MSFNILNEPLLIIFHPEKVVGLHDLGHFAAAFGAFAFHQVFFGEKAFIAHAVPAHIFGLVDQIAVVKILQNFADHFFVISVSSTDKAVVGNAELLPQFFEAHHSFVAMLLAAEVVFFGGALHLLTVFIGTGQKERFIPGGTVKTRKHIRPHGSVAVADVGLVVHIVYRSGYIEFLIHN